jgi:glyoxylase-like metal-dependent hydrolase (beta-lactamase superfamily II)
MAEGQKSGVDDLITAGEREPGAIAVNDFICMTRDISNSYLVLTAEGNVLINAGASYAAPRKQAAYGTFSSAPIRAAIVTQNHPDHYGGLKVLLPEGADLIVSARYPTGMAERQALASFYAPRTNKLWHGVVGDKMDRPAAKPKAEIAPTVLVEDHHAFTLGGRRFEIIALPGGETLDGIGVWLPDGKIAFIGNLLGPAYLNVPNLNTLRGDRPRCPQRYIDSVSRIRDLAPELLITGHGDPIHGATRIRDDLDRMIEAMRSVLGQTIAGMAAGKDVWTLMREVRVPAEFGLAEAFGKTAWNVRSIWEQLAGWFHYDSTTSLYAVPRREVSQDLAELAGGAGSLATRAAMLLEQGKPVHALHLIDIALEAEPGHPAAREVKRAAHQYLLDHGGTANLNESMWLKSELKILDTPEES